MHARTGSTRKKAWLLPLGCKLDDICPVYEEPEVLDPILFEYSLETIVCCIIARSAKSAAEHIMSCVYLGDTLGRRRELQSHLFRFLYQTALVRGI